MGQTKASKAHCHALIALLVSVGSLRAKVPWRQRVGHAQQVAIKIYRE